MEEFEIARQQHKTIIPIAYPGMVSSSIWNMVKQSITEYPSGKAKLIVLLLTIRLINSQKLLFRFWIPSYPPNTDLQVYIYNFPKAIILYSQLAN